MKAVPILLAFGVFTLAGCADFQDVVPTPTTPLTHPAPSVSQAQVSVDEVSRALALAMHHKDVRVQVRNAMRSSRVTEHKLLLGEFLSTPAGRRVLQIAARESGLTSEALMAKVRALPPLDFYAPFREHRLYWRATEDVLVGAVLDTKQSSLRSFDSRGREVLLHQSGGMPTRALLILQSAERKSLRIDAQADVPGDVIQDAVDGETSGSLEWTDATGRVHIMPLALLNERRVAGGNRQQQISTLSSQSPSAGLYSPVDEVICDLNDPLACPNYDVSPGPTSSDTTYLGYVKISYDDGHFGGGCELEFHAEYTKDGQVVGRRTLRLDGVGKNVPYYLTIPLIFNEIRPASADKIRVRVVETDWADDDDQGSIDVFEKDRSRVLTISDHAFWGLASEETHIALDWYL